MTVFSRIGRSSSLRWRLALAYAVVLAVALGVVLLVAGSIVERALIESTASRLEIEAGLLATETGGKRGVTATDLAAGDLAAVLGGQQTAVVVLDPTGATMASEAHGASADVVDARLDANTYASILASGQATNGVVPGAATERVRRQSIRHARSSLTSAHRRRRGYDDDVGANFIHTPRGKRHVIVAGLKSLP